MAYLGVMVDDLVTRGVQEPYRMFTSRAEYRLSLREDNADARLTEIGRQYGLVDDRRWTAFNRKRDAVAQECERLRSTWVNPRVLDAVTAEAVLGKAIEREYSLADLLRRPHVRYANLMNMKDGTWQPAQPLTDDVQLLEQIEEQIEISIKYQGYIERQAEDIERQSAQEVLRLPPDFDFSQVRGLSKEVQQKLNQHRPETLGQASRIQGITPAAVSLLIIHLKKGLGRRATELKA
jgi:tRNA uridine 5-carboxymethylaminomethyl modification enzyme